MFLALVERPASVADVRLEGITCEAIGVTNGGRRLNSYAAIASCPSIVGARHRRSTSASQRRSRTMVRQRVAAGAYTMECTFTDVAIVLAGRTFVSSRTAQSACPESVPRGRARCKAMTTSHRVRNGPMNADQAVATRGIHNQAKDLVRHARGGCALPRRAVLDAFVTLVAVQEGT